MSSSSTGSDAADRATGRSSLNIAESAGRPIARIRRASARRDWISPMKT